MRHLGFVLAAGLLATGAPAPALAHQPAKAAAGSAAETPQAARPAKLAVESFHAALAAGDTQKALSFLAPDVLIVEEGGAERSRAEYAGHHLAADAAFTRAVPSTPLSSTGHAAGDLAYVVSESRMTGAYGGKPVDRLSAETMILRKGPTGWKIVHIHWSSHAAKPK
jgi:ketosteroid isomerase-like protein